jgi:hypothetical protein
VMTNLRRINPNIKPFLIPVPEIPSYGSFYEQHSINEPAENLLNDPKRRPS